jgi:hypothetical protein
LENTYVTVFQSSENTYRTFCGKCGTHLTFYYEGDDDDMASEEHWGPYFDVAVGTLERDSAEMEGLRPGRHSWWDEGLEWVKGLTGVWREGSAFN